MLCSYRGLSSSTQWSDSLICISMKHRSDLDGVLGLLNFIEDRFIDRSATADTLPSSSLMSPCDWGWGGVGGVDEG